MARVLVGDFGISSFNSSFISDMDSSVDAIIPVMLSKSAESFFTTASMPGL